MKREMKSNIFKNICFSLILLLFTSCSFFQNREKNIATPDMVYTAIFLDDSYNLNKYLSEGFPVDYRDPSNKTLLMSIVESNSLKSLDVILNKGVNLELKDDRGRTAIFYVRSLEALKKLVEIGADKDVVLNDGTPLFTYFLKDKSILYSLYLIEKGSNYTLEDEDGWNSLFWAVVIGNSDIVRALREDGADFLIQDMKGNSPIYYAYDEKILLELLNVPNYNLNLKNKQGENILGEVYLRAVANGYLEVVKKLLELGVNPRYISYGDSAISIAKERENLEMIKFLNDNNIK